MSATVLLAGGGSGGHVAPALATAEALGRLAPHLQVAFVGTSRGLEATMVPAAGWRLHEVEAAPLRHRGLVARLRAPWTVLRAALGLRRLLRREQVVAACTFGGYVSGPLALAARLAGVPLVVHEQNAVPGLANRLAARWARAVALSVPGTEGGFPHPERAVVTGNPVRGHLAALDRAGRRAEALERFGLDPSRRTLLAFGGSLGARSVNDALLDAAARWPRPETVQVLHLAGARQYAEVVEAWGRDGDERLLVRCLPFVEDMELAYAAADLALCRSGASTVAELCAVGLPALLVPYPHAAADEQTANARALAEAGAALVVADADLSGATLVDALAPLLADDDRLARMAAAAARLGRPDAADAVARLVLAAARDRLPDAGGAMRQDGEP